jgi:hypothetical protein
MPEPRSHVKLAVRQIETALEESQANERAGLASPDRPVAVDISVVALSRPTN